MALKKWELVCVIWFRQGHDHQLPAVAIKLRDNKGGEFEYSATGATLPEAVVKAMVGGVSQNAHTTVWWLPDSFSESSNGGVTVVKLAMAKSQCACPFMGSGEGDSLAEAAARACIDALNSM